MMKKHINKKRILLILIFLCFALAVFAGYQIVSSLVEYSDGKQAYESLPVPQKIYRTSAVSEYEESQEISDEAANETMSFTVDFDALLDINPDCKAWLLCEGTDFSYPVVQGDDNEYYLKHMFNGDKNGAGCLFIDAANQPNFSDKNSIIYGHAMNNGTMFASLLEYENQEYYESHPVMQLLTADASYQIKIFAAGVVSLDSRVWETNFQTQDEFVIWLDEVLTQSQIITDVEPDLADRVLTLSTCTYGNGDERFVVLGVLVLNE